MKKQSVSIPCLSVLMMSKESKQPRLFLMPGEYTFQYDYPLSMAVEIKRHLDSATGALDILWLAAQDYKKIYENPDEYGIWGHDMCDLVFERIHVDGDKISFSIGS